MDFNYFTTEYITAAREAGMIKIEPVIDQSEIDPSTFVVSKTKETYVFSSEEDANELINNAHQLDTFAAAAKTFKAGKKNKAGEEIAPDTWKVVLKFNF